MCYFTVSIISICHEESITKNSNYVFVDGFTILFTQIHILISNICYMYFCLICFRFISQKLVKLIEYAVFLYAISGILTFVINRTKNGVLIKVERITAIGVISSILIQVIVSSQEYVVKSGQQYLVLHVPYFVNCKSRFSDGYHTTHMHTKTRNRHT